MAKFLPIGVASARSFAVEAIELSVEGGDEELDQFRRDQACLETVQNTGFDGLAFNGAGVVTFPCFCALNNRIDLCQ